MKWSNCSRAVWQDSRKGNPDIYVSKLTAGGNAWNAADRLTTRGSDTFGYDPLDRLTSSTVSATARTYTYNGDGLLQSRTPGTATAFLWDPHAHPICAAV